MPETMSKERRAPLRAFGADLVLTPGSEGMKGAIAKAEEIRAQSGAVLVRQFTNQANPNPEVHRRTTAQEIWDDADGTVDIYVAGIGTGSPITGVGQVLRQKKPGVQITVCLLRWCLVCRPRGGAHRSGDRVVRRTWPARLSTAAAGSCWNRRRRRW